MPIIQPTTMLFDDMLAALLKDAENKGSVDAALDGGWLERLDDTFIPSLANLVNAATPEELPKLLELQKSLDTRTEKRYERARDQLQTLLGAGELNKMDAALCSLVRKGEVDAGLFYVLLRNQEDARASGDEGGERLMIHLHSRLQEELEKRSEPALALLHKLTRMDMPGVRANLLRQNLVPQTETLLPDGTTLPINPPAPAAVQPMAFAGAIEGALDKIVQLPIAQEAIYATAEDIRQVAMEARTVVAESYNREELEEFQNALTGPFSRALPPRAPPEAPAAEAEAA